MRRKGAVVLDRARRAGEVTDRALSEQTMAGPAECRNRTFCNRADTRASMHGRSR